MGGDSLYGGHVRGRAYAFNGGDMTDVELVSLCAVAMALLNLYLLRVISNAGRAVNMAWQILNDVAKGEVTLGFKDNHITVVAVKKQ